MVFDSDALKVTLRPEHQQIMTAHVDGSVRLLDLESFAEIVRFYKFNDDRNWIAIRPDGKFFGSEGIATLLRWNKDETSGPDAFKKYRNEKAIQSSILSGPD